MLVPILLFIVGLVLLIKGGDWFVDGATGLAHRFHVPEILIGATVVSIGTTLPEVMVSATSAVSGHGEIAYGNAIGSVICNTALIAALTIAIRPSEADRRSLRTPVIFFFIAAVFYAAIAYTNGAFTRLAGIVLLGVGLAMDAFSVSLANGLNEPHMSRRRMLGIAGVFAAFQALMPMTGWICVHTIVQYFRAFEKLIPWIALALLGFIGGKMLIEGIRGGGDDDAAPRLGLGALLVQGVATSIDALSVGFTIAEYDWLMALVCSLIIAAVTLCICLGGLVLGRKFGMRLAGRAQILGGAILIFIGLEIFISSML